MKKTVNKSLLLFGAVALLILSACGSKKTNGTGLGGEQPGLGGTPISTSTAASLIHCNSFSGASFSGAINAYTDNFGNIYTESSRVLFTQIPANIQTSGSHFEFFRWSADDNGSNLDSTPASFYLESRLTGAPLSGILTSFSNADMTSFAGQIGIAANWNTFIQEVTFVITGLDISYDALQLVNYTNDNPVGNVNFLIPSFSAHPDEYAASHPDVLNQLHPFTNSSSSASTAQEFATLSQSSCF